MRHAMSERHGQTRAACGPADSSSFKQPEGDALDGAEKVRHDERGARRWPQVSWGELEHVVARGKR